MQKPLWHDHIVLIFCFFIYFYTD